MASFIAKRLISLLIILFGMTVLIFAVTHLLPGDPARAAAGPTASNEDVARIRSELGLDLPLIQQYWISLKKLAALDLGVSVRSLQPVADEIGSRLAATMELTLISVVLYVLLSIALGVFAATRRSGWIDNGIRLLSVGSMAIPPYWLALLLQLIFYYYLNWLPSGGRLPLSVAPPDSVTGLYLLDSLLSMNGQALFYSSLYLILPVASLVIGHFGLTTRLMRSRLVQEFGQDYVRTARAKGVSSGAIVYKHTLRNSITPVVTMVGLQAGYMMGGTVLIEAIFRWPGLGSYALSAITNMDFPAISGVAITLSLIFVLVNLLVDILYVLLDPRVRVS
ncbi:ABC transporter permease [Paenibacillaceae bacterium WGS1546]|uniref:ABC transporter permease n=1 Tax=Cohnella sp. WGS1546 TaxID=3366810 RepID=UPI00372D694C